MAYIQITTRCNMSCVHCCYRCTPEGEDMSIETFQNALAFEGECIAIGGGEPTLHPQFWEFIGVALGSADFVWLATNGSQKLTSLALAKLTAKQVLQCEISLDEYHDYSMVDVEVRHAFSKIKGSVRDVTRNGEQYPVNAGRWKDWKGRADHEGRDECVCPEAMIRPNGDIMACGCEDAPLMGNVNTYGPDFEYPADYEWGECWKGQECFKQKGGDAIETHNAMVQKV